MHIQFGTIVFFLHYIFSTVFPEPVSELSVVSLSKTSITVSWNYQSNGSSPRTSVDISVMAGNVLLSYLTGQPNETSITLDDLMDQTTYTIRVYAVTEHGRSAATSIEAQTLRGNLCLLFSRLLW